MAPETLASQTCTTKADIYSLGIILFELLTHFDTAMERVVVSQFLH
jgi:serine/threonine protein kinase